MEENVLCCHERVSLQLEDIPALSASEFTLAAAYGRRRHLIVVTIPWTKHVLRFSWFLVFTFVQRYQSWLDANCSIFPVMYFRRRDKDMIRTSSRCYSTRGVRRIYVRCSNASHHRLGSKGKHQNHYPSAFLSRREPGLRFLDRRC